jgi:SMI1 / KNR4 family (SUKH-1)
VRVPFKLDERFIIAAEQMLAASLPNAYRQAMMTSNGGQVIAHDDVWELHPILDTSDRRRLKRSCNDILHETAFMRDWPSWPENALAIGSNGGGDRLVLLKVNRWYEPTIYVWLHDTSELVPIANVFSDLRRPL